MSSPEIRKAPSVTGTFGTRQECCVICKAKIKKHRIMKILVSHSPNDAIIATDLQVASFKYKIPLCEEHSGLANKEDHSVRVKLSWEEENV